MEAIPYKIYSSGEEIGVLVFFAEGSFFFAGCISLSI
jgi:hypothetical protein